MNANDLLRFVREAKPKFIPRFEYDGESDCLFAYLRDVDYIRRRVDKVVTVYEAEDDGEMAGCVIKGVRKLLAEANPFGLEIGKGNKVRVSIVLFAYIEKHPAIMEKLGSKNVRSFIETARNEELVLC